MSFLKDLGQNLGQTVTNVAESVVERGQHLSSQAQLQLSIKKLQMERTRRTQELGRRTYGWYQSGKLATAGTVPPDITDICRQIENLERQLEENQRRLEEVKLQAQTSTPSGDEPGEPSATSTVLVSVSTPDDAGGTAGTPGTPQGTSPPYPG